LYIAQQISGNPIKQSPRIEKKFIQAKDIATEMDIKGYLFLNNKFKNKYIPIYAVALTIKSHIMYAVNGGKII
jgi:hypothetical protein